MKALLIATLMMVGGNEAPSVTTNVIPDSKMCGSAMEQVVANHRMKNHIISSGPGYVKAELEPPRSSKRPAQKLTVTCKPLL